MSPPLFHGDNQLSRGKSSAVHSRTSESGSGQSSRRQKENRSYKSSLDQSFHSSRQNPHASEKQVRFTQKSIFRVTSVQESSKQQALCEQRQWLHYFAGRADIGGAEVLHHSTEKRSSREQRRRLHYFANRPVIGCAELSYHSTEQQVLSEQRRRVPYYASRPLIGGAKLSHHSTKQQALCEQRRRLTYFANRPDIGGVELSHHSTEQQALCEQRQRLTYFANRALTCRLCGTLTPQHRTAGFV